MIITNATLISKSDSPDRTVSFLRFEVEKSFSFNEGQFIMIESPYILDSNNKTKKRAYSIGTTYEEMDTGKTIGTIVKKASDYGLSAYLTQDIKIGGKVTITGPLGHFHNDCLHKDYLFIGIGSGITPLFSMYQSLLHRHTYHKIAFLYGERFAHILIPELLHLGENNNDNIHMGLYLSQEKNPPIGRKPGRIDTGLGDALHFLGTKNMKVFICGKPEMVDNMRNTLGDYGIHTNNIHFEKY